jgi:hypothetical protein
LGILVSVGRFLTGAAAFLVVIVGVLGGGAASDQAHMGFLIGASVGGLVGLVIAGTVFGAIAALFQIADSTARTARAMEKLEARAPRG